MKKSIQTGWASRPGRHTPVNQDHLGWYIPQDPAVWARRGALFIVADGMGSHAAGGAAGQTAVQVVLSHYYADLATDPARCLQAALARADQWLGYWTQVRPDLQGMGTTLSAAAVWNRELVVAHVGDSRVYVVRQGRAWAVTRDHTWVAQALESGDLTPQEVRRHPWRNVLTRSLSGVGAVAEVQRVLLQPGDRLVLLTDGVSDWVGAPEIAHLAGRFPRRAAQALVSLARQRGEGDDATALVVKIEEPARRARAAVKPSWRPASANATPIPLAWAQDLSRQLWLIGGVLGAVGLLLLLLTVLA